LLLSWTTRTSDVLERLATVVESAMKSVPAKSYKDRRTYE
jgi:hypothetical protein